MKIIWKEKYYISELEGEKFIIKFVYIKNFVIFFLFFYLFIRISSMSSISTERLQIGNQSFLFCMHVFGSVSSHTDFTWPYDFPWTIKQNKWKVLVHKVTLSCCWEPFSYIWMSPGKNSEGERTVGERLQLSSHSSSLGRSTLWLRRSTKWAQAGNNTQMHHRIRNKCIIIGFASALWSVFLPHKIWLMLLSLWYLVI